MGFKQTYIAVENRPVEEICADLRVNQTSELLEVEERPVCLTKWSDKTPMICVNHWEPPDQHLMWKLSRNTTATFCFVNETVMFSTSEQWVNGELLWHASHDSSVSLNHLATKGVMPDSFAEIHKKYEDTPSEPDGVDNWFDAPVDLFESLYGIRYGTESGMLWQTLASFD